MPIADREASYLEQHDQYVPVSQEITKKVLSEKDNLLEKHVDDCENNKKYSKTEMKHRDFGSY